MPKLVVLMSQRYSVLLFVQLIVWPLMALAAMVFISRLSFSDLMNERAKVIPIIILAIWEILSIYIIAKTMGLLYKKIQDQSL